MNTIESKIEAVSIDRIAETIRTLRGKRIILDADLAAVYGVPTKRLNEQFHRNRERFPEDFAFQLTAEESAGLKSQITMSKANRSQIATGSQKHRDPRFLPYAFTEHGALMAANILRSPRALAMSIYVIRAFVKMREDQAANAALLKRLAEIDRTLLVHDTALRDIYEKLRPLLAPPPDPPQRKIGFREEPVPCRVSSQKKPSQMK